MKKVIGFAILAGVLAGCYTPLNNSGVATTKPWLEIPAKRVDFSGKQYDSCYRFDLRFWPPEAAERLDLQQTCLSACCWRSDKEEVTLDFNKNFEHDLAAYGRARKYNPGQITLKVNHANWLNTTRVTISPRRSITTNGLVKLSYKEYDNPARLAQLEVQARQAAQAAAQQVTTEVQQTQPPAVTKPTKPKTVKPSSGALPALVSVHPAQTLLQRIAGPKIDSYFYQMNKRYHKQGAVFLLSERLLYPQVTDTDTYLVSCLAKARTGLDSAHLQASTFPCGQWLVNINTQTVTPYDSRAKLMWNP